MTAGRIWAGSLAAATFAILAIYALSSVVAFFVIVAGTVWLAGVVGGAAAVGAWADERKGRVDAEARAEDLEDELGSAIRAAESLVDELSHADDTIANLAAQVAAQAETYVGDKGTRLYAVPPQRDGSEYEWPRIARVLDIEAGEQG